METLKINPRFQAQIPPLAPDEFAQLEQNILAEGCRDPIVVWLPPEGFEKTILDGHNRYSICQKHSLSFNTVTVDLETEDDAEDWIDANQLGRRNLTPDQASILRGRRYNRTKKVMTATLRRGTAAPLEQSVPAGSTAEALAKQHGVSHMTIKRDGKRAEAFERLMSEAPEKAKNVWAGEKRFSEVRREIKKQELQKAASLPDAKYRVIYSDPPWCYNDKCDDGGVQQGGGCERHYPSMTIAELCALPIKSMVENDAVLFLWVTSPLLFECLPIIESWGFSYKASFVWDKVKHNMGHYNSVRHELLLICTRGSCTPDTTQLFDSVQSIERTRHSAKPAEFRKIIETLYTHGKRLEMFAREKSDGWDVWGNQV